MYLGGDNSGWIDAKNVIEEKIALQIGLLTLFGDNFELWGEMVIS